MDRFIVSVREVHVQRYGVDAKDAEDAISKVINGEGDLMGNSHTLDPETWTVEKGERR